jgi:hypothetical protein
VERKRILLCAAHCSTNGCNLSTRVGKSRSCYILIANISSGFSLFTILHHSSFYATQTLTKSGTNLFCELKEDMIYYLLDNEKCSTGTTA